MNPRTKSQPRRHLSPPDCHQALANKVATQYFDLSFGTTLMPEKNIGLSASSTPIKHISLPNDKYKIELDVLRGLYIPNGDPHRALELAAQAATAFPEVQPKRILVTGGAGFVGSHLVDRLMLLGHHVTVLDNFFTGTKTNVSHWIGHARFKIICQDVVACLAGSVSDLEVDQIYHLACPASPVHYQQDPVKTLQTCIVGTLNMLELAKLHSARLLLSSTSEVYGDPLVHPQSENYWGNVNPIGPRACYDEGKRSAETLVYAYHTQYGLDVRVVRIFNTYGPRMNEQDGRVVSNFILQALQQKPITVYGEGRQTRSFQYIHDLVSGMIAAMELEPESIADPARTDDPTTIKPATNVARPNEPMVAPINLGNPDEHEIGEFAQIVCEMVHVKTDLIHGPPVVDDPQRRRPDITRATNLLGWRPTFPLYQGLDETIEYFRQRLHTHLLPK